MEDFDSDHPSFSLGFDLDLQSEPISSPRPDPLVKSQAAHSSIANSIRTVKEEEEEEGNDNVYNSPFRVSNSPTRAFKRLRRGPKIDALVLGKDADDDDEIEGFSEDEDWLMAGNLATTSLCGSSKSSLRVQSVLTSKSSKESKSSKGKDTESASASVNVGKCGGDILFPRLTISPLRKFQLIDSDSDDPSPSRDINEDRHHIFFSKNKDLDSGKHTGLIDVDLETNRSLSGKCKNEDLWENFHSDKKIPTPAFDEIFQEYFTTGKSTSKAEVNDKDLNNEGKHDVDSLPPSHNYYFHEDPRIQRLVRDRLPHFFPLGAGNNQEHRQQSASVIDYMDQFGDGNSTRKTDQKRVPKPKSRSKKGSKNMQSESMLQDSDNWVNPRASSEIPKNAGNRRVQAVGKSSGHWYTASDGRRVYVSKNGQELTGQSAYRSYRKESGAGFKNTKKKATANNKTAAKKRSAPKKK